MFATFATICLGIAASLSLTQANWRALKLHNTNLKTLDALYNLPRITALLDLVRSIKSMQLLYVAIIAVLVQALVLISLLAPGAMETALRSSTQQSIRLPQLNFSSALFAGSSDPSEYWTQNIDEIQALSISKLWDPPKDCGDSCSFSVSYSAPMLTCRDIYESESLLTPYDTSMGFDTTWGFYESDDTQLFFAETWQDAANPSFLINYMNISFHADDHSLTVTSGGQLGGSVCTCRDGTYDSTFVLSRNKKTITTKPPTLGNQLSTTCPWNRTSIKDATECGFYAANSLQFCQTFANNLAGWQRWDGDFHELNGFVWDGFLLGQLFNSSFNDTGDGSIYLTPKNNDLTTTIADVFNNVTVGLLPKLHLTANITVDVMDGTSIWIYDPYTLWRIYSPGLAAVLAIVAYGFYCIHSNNNTALDLKFSTIMITTRTEALDKVYQTTSNYDHLMKTELKFDKESGTFVPVGGGSEDSLEE